MLTEEQASLQKVIRDFAQQEIAPKAAYYDEAEEFPWENLHKMAELGLLGMPVAEEFGGAGTDTVSYIAAIEEISKACASTGAIMDLHVRYGRTETEICSRFSDWQENWRLCIDGSRRWF
jgi:alkylation response protein AidB-like acyl-CoA dehydrogenase